MKPNDLEDARKIALLIEQGTAEKRDVLALLMYVREELPNSMIKDLAHSVAHTTRNRGYAYDKIEAFVARMITFFERGGTLSSEPIFEANALIKEMSKELSRLGIPLKRSLVFRNRAPLFTAIEALLLGVSVELRNPKIRSCTFERLSPDDPNSFCFVIATIGLTGGVVTMSSEARIAFPLFSSNIH